MSPTKTRLAAVLSALFLLLIPVACGSDDDDGSPARGTTTEQTGTAETETGEDTTEEP